MTVSLPSEWRQRCSGDVSSAGCGVRIISNSLILGQGGEVHADAAVHDGERFGEIADERGRRLLAQMALAWRIVRRR